MQLRPEAEKFLKEVVPSLQAAGADCGAAPDELSRCLSQALLISGGGKYTHWHNPWGLQGEGSAGFVWRAHLVSDTSQPGSARLVKAKLAKFSSWREACGAWLRAQRNPNHI
jgi:hypothetical protein